MGMNVSQVLRCEDLCPGHEAGVQGCDQDQVQDQGQGEEQVSFEQGPQICNLKNNTLSSITSTRDM